MKKRSSLRKKADKAKKLRCKNLIAVLEQPDNIRNIGAVVRNINALGVEKIYIVDPNQQLPEDWQEMRTKKSLMATSSSAIKWSFVKTFNNTEECILHLAKRGFVSIVTSPHIKGKTNVYLSEGNYTQKKLAVWFGNETHGISDLAVNASEACINIEMCGIVESLNLATSTGIILYEITRQRREYQKNHQRSIRRNPKIKQ